MKNLEKVFCAISLAALLPLTSCSDNDDNKPDDGDDNKSELPFIYNENEIGNGDQEYEINGEYTLPKGTYILKGWCYVTKGAKLTIEPGTVIKGDKNLKSSLIVEPGGQLFAKGTKNNPIVFTSNQPAGSRKPGDWGGLIICGNGVNNKVKQIIEGGPRTEHGAVNGAAKEDDNSGILSYVRVEFAGSIFNVDQEINGVTFGSVGSGTQVDHVQVSYSNDDSFEWFGGSVNCKYLVAYHGWDDDFDTDNGYSGKVQYALGVRNPKSADTSLSNGFESDNNSTAGTESPFTSCVFSNVTLVGPKGQRDDFQNNSSFIDGGDYNGGAKTGTFQAAMQIRRNSRLNCFNSVAMGYPVGIIIENDKGSSTQDWASQELLKLNNLYFADMDIIGSDVNKTWKDIFSNDAGKNVDESKISFSHSYFENQGNSYFENISDLKLKQPNSLISGSNYGPTVGSPLLNAAKFTDSMLNAGFDKVTYVGAFNGENDDWMNSWTNFDPQNTQY
ncbi:MAG: hypothetical protein Q4F97_00905 [Bacteroidales bacterium]|nr:hypothetical protein [Bacteroidales bacterium]